MATRGDEPARRAKVLRQDDRAARWVSPLFPAARLLKAGVLDAEATVLDANRLLEEARQQATMIIAQAHLEAERVQSEAKSSGLALGESIARRVGQQLELDRMARERAHAMDAVDIAIHLVRRFVGDAIRVNRGALQEFMQRALDQIADTRGLVIEVHPSLADAMRTLLPKLQERYGNDRWRVVEDDRLAPDDVRVRGTDFAGYDAGVNPQIEALASLRAELIRSMIEPRGDE